jgi:hypothetical protein
LVFSSLKLQRPDYLDVLRAHKLKIDVISRNSKKRFWGTLLLTCLLGGCLAYWYLESTSHKEIKTGFYSDAELLEKYAATLKTVGNFLGDIHNPKDGKTCEQKSLVFIQEGKDILNQGLSQLVCSKELTRHIEGIKNASVIVKSEFESIVSPAEHLDVIFYLQFKGGRWHIQRITDQYSQDYNNQISG